MFIVTSQLIDLMTYSPQGQGKEKPNRVVTIFIIFCSNLDGQKDDDGDDEPRGGEEFNCLVQNIRILLQLIHHKRQESVLHFFVSLKLAWKLIELSF